MRYTVVYWALAVVAGAQGGSAQQHGDVRGRVLLDLSSDSLHASLDVDYVAPTRADSTLVFYLNGTANISQVSCARCAGFRFDRGQRLPSLVITLQRPLAAGEHEAIAFRYSLSIANSHQREFSWLELGLDDFWFPVHPDFTAFRFTHDITIAGIDPAYQVVGNGNPRQGGAQWHSRSMVPDNDIDIVAARGLQMKRYADAGFDLRVFSSNLPDSVTVPLLDQMRRVLTLYNRWFPAQPQRSMTAVFRSHPVIQGKGGYFRKGYFVLDRTLDARRYLMPVAHELAHNWFLSAPSEHAWLNESFAEYVAMLAMRAERGRAAFDSVLLGKQQNADSLPPIYGFDRRSNPRASPRVLYVKGPVRLAELEAWLGEERFLGFLREVSERRIRDTDTLLVELERYAGLDVSARFRSLLQR